MPEKEIVYLCNHCGQGLTEDNRCGTYMKCYGCGNYGNMEEVASMANKLEKKVEASI